MAFDELSKCKKESTSCSVKPSLAASDRVICLNGHVCCEGTPQVVSDAPEYRALFGLGTQGALALYRHEHDHDHGPAAPADTPWYATGKGRLVLLTGGLLASAMAVAADFALTRLERRLRLGRVG